MDDELVFIVSYECPRCHASLEARASGPPSWLRCPGCGRASLPPDHERITMPIIDEDTLVIGNFVTGSPSLKLPIRPRSMAPLPPMMASKASTTRLLMGTAFFLTTFLCIFSLLESRGALAVISGVGAAFFLYLLSRPVRPSYRE